jgi:hypothetical protein
MDLSRTRWAALTAGERTRTTKALAKQLPDGFAFDRVRVCKLGRHKNAVAFFTHGGATFALIPGGQVAVGYDTSRPWEATEEEAESWQFTKDEYGLRGSIRQRIAGVTRRPKAITVPPLLVETAAGELGWEPFDANDPQVRKLLREHRTAPQVTLSYPDGNALRVSRNDDGTVTAERSEARTHAELNALLKRSGFRFPKVDEWEYLCGAGAETLFRWGDHAPCDCYPVGSAGEHRTVHRQPNAFGLMIAFDPYQFELTATPGTTRGGDGGHYACGGAGFFISWLVLATAYFEREACRHDRTEPIDHGYTVGRRVLELG